MTLGSAQPASVPLLRPVVLVAGVVGAAFGAIAVTALVLVMLSAGSEAWRAWAAASAITIVSAGLSLPLVLIVAAKTRVDLPPDEMPKVMGLAVTAGLVRVVVVGAGMLLAVKLADVSRWPALAMTAVGYVSILAVEVGLLGRAFWRVDAARPRSALPSQPVPEHPPEHTAGVG